MRFKKICAFAMAMLMMVLLASCNGNPTETTDPSTGGTGTAGETTGTNAPETTETEPGEQTTSSDTTSSSGGGEIPSLDAGLDIEYMQIGDYVTLVYNAATCEVEYEVERGLGSRQTVTLTANN